MTDRWTKRAESVHRHGHMGVSKWNPFGHVPQRVEEEDDDVAICKGCGKPILGLVYKSDKHGNNYHMSCAS